MAARGGHMNVSEPHSTVVDRHAFDASLRAGGSQQYARNTGRDRLFARCSGMLDLVTDPATGTIRPEFLRRRSCPLCGAAGPHAQRFVKYQIPIVECSACPMVFASPCLSPAGEKRVYEDSTLWIDEHARFLASPTYTRYARLRHTYQLQLIERFAGAGAPRTHLDVGAATGGFVEVAAAFGWATQGIDSNPRVVEVARARGLEVIAGWFSREAVVGSYGLVSLLDVLEHVADVGPLLDDLARTVAPGGLLFVQVPNLNSLCVELVGSEHHSLNGLFHLNYFCADTLVGLVEGYGFAACHVETILTELSVVQSYAPEVVAAALAKRGVAAQSGGLDPDAILDHGLGYKLLAVFRRA